METEIFRHLRSTWFDRRNSTLIPNPMGGVSFLLHPRAEKTYDFWVYICPETATFSAKQSVKTLRERHAAGIVPFGTISLTDEPLIEQLIRFVLNEEMALPSELGKQILEILICNISARSTFEKVKLAASSAVELYEAD